MTTNIISDMLHAIIQEVKDSGKAEYFDDNAASMYEQYVRENPESVFVEENNSPCISFDGYFALEVIGQNYRIKNYAQELEIEKTYPYLTLDPIGIDRKHDDFSTSQTLL